MFEQNDSVTDTVKQLQQDLMKRPLGIAFPSTVMEQPFRQRIPTIRLWRHLMVRTIKTLDKMPAPDEQYDHVSRKTFETKLKRECIHMARDLDELNRQLHDPEQVIHINVCGKETGDHIVTIHELDLHPVKEGKDTRTPIIFIGGGPSAGEQNISLSLALALAGHRVFIPTFPEKTVNKPHDWRERVEKYGHGDFRLHFKVFKQAIETLTRQRGITELDIVGHSVGGYMALQFAKEGVAACSMRHIAAIEPVGFEEVPLLKRMIQFAVLQGFKTATHVEDHIKMTLEGAKLHMPSALDWLMLGKLSCKKVFTPRFLEEIDARKCLIFTSDASPVIDELPIKTMVAETKSQTTPIKVITLTGTDHGGSITRPFGFVKVLHDQLGESPSDADTFDINGLSSPVEMLLQQSLDGESELT